MYGCHLSFAETERRAAILCFLLKGTSQDLEERVEWFLSHLEEAQRVVHNLVNTFRGNLRHQQPRRVIGGDCFMPLETRALSPSLSRTSKCRSFGVKETQKQLRH